MDDFVIRTREDLVRAVEAYGFLPLFRNPVSGFSVEEHASPEVWYSEGDSRWDVWEWKGPVIREIGCAYGKFFGKKAAFVSREWFPDLANYRRDGYDFDARWDDGLVSYADKDLYELIDRTAPVLSTELKYLGGYGKGGRKGFDTSVTRLQAQGYVIISDFIYETDRSGRRCGWGVAQYSTPEKFFGEEFRKEAYRRTPEESFTRVLGQLKKILPDAEEAVLRKILR